MEVQNQYPVVLQPKRIRLSLYRHQLTSIYYMEQLEYNQNIKLGTFEDLKTRVGILSDLTGYGKTFSILGLIERDKMLFNVNEDFLTIKYLGNNAICQKIATIYKKINCNLIVLNNTLLNQWESEVQKTSMSYYVINSKKNVEEFNPQNYEIVLCNSSMYSLLIARFRKFCWKRLILDEPLTLKITDFNNFAFNFIWLVTATPYEMIAKTKSTTLYEDIFCKNEYLLERVILRNPDKYVKESFTMPDNIHYYYESYNPISKILDGIISPMLLEMILAGNIKEVIKYLGGVTDKDSLYNLVKEKKIKKLEEIDKNLEDEEKDQEKILEKRKIIEGQIKDLEDRLKKELEESCIICSKNLHKPMLLTCCQNIICSECILTWLNTKPNCPLCRSNLTNENLVLIEEKNDTIKKYKNIKKTKPQIICDLIESNKKGKFIIFSNYDESFISVKKLFDEKDINYCEIKGGKDSRSKNLESFKTEDIQVLFLNSKSNGAGINLQETTDIILYHQMSEFSQTQVLGRANRIGRKEKLNIHHLI
jgi:hypothetical protein